MDPCHLEMSFTGQLRSVPLYTGAERYLPHRYVENVHADGHFFTRGNLYLSLGGRDLVSRLLFLEQKMAFVLDALSLLENCDNSTELRIAHALWKVFPRAVISLVLLHLDLKPI